MLTLSLEQVLSVTITIPIVLVDK